MTTWQRSLGFFPAFHATIAWAEAIPRSTALCPLCNYDGPGVVVRSFTVNGQVFWVARCPADGMMYLDPQPTAAFYRTLYDEHYFDGSPDHPLYEQGCTTIQVDPAREAHKARLNMDLVERYATGPWLLDVGFGSGALLAEARARGYDTYRGYHTFGLETSQWALEQARQRGLNVANWDFLAYRPLIEPDVITMMSVLEHVEHPRAWLRHARTLLRTGGVLVLRLPDTPDAGPDLALFEHRWHFNQRTITALLEQEGYRVLEISGFGQWQGERCPGAIVSMNVVARPHRVRGEW